MDEVHNIVQEAVTKIIQKKEKYKKTKWLSEEALQIVEKEEKQKTKEKGKDILIWFQSSKQEQGNLRKSC